jgi:hypothetical protein
MLTYIACLPGSGPFQLRELFEFLVGYAFLKFGIELVKALVSGEASLFQSFSGVSFLSESR